MQEIATQMERCGIFCINHHDCCNWAKLELHGQKAYKTLGWDADVWDGPDTAHPPSN
jgi:hypothetical protein